MLIPLFTYITEITRDRLLAIVPWCDIEIVPEMFKYERASRLLSGQPDYVLDCIDDCHTKGELIAYCIQSNIKVLTSMGAGGKSDPTRLRIAPLNECINDPLASKIKWKLKKLGVNYEYVMSIFSIEKTVAELLPLDDEQAKNPQGKLDIVYILCHTYLHM